MSFVGRDTRSLFEKATALSTHQRKDGTYEIIKQTRDTTDYIFYDELADPPNTLMYDILYGRSIGDTIRVKPPKRYQTKEEQDAEKKTADRGRRRLPKAKHD
jgi:hypothetical protein